MPKYGNWPPGPTPLIFSQTFYISVFLSTIHIQRALNHFPTPIFGGVMAILRLLGPNAQIWKLGPRLHPFDFFSIFFHFLISLHHTHPTSPQPLPNFHFWRSYGHFHMFGPKFPNMEIGPRPHPFDFFSNFLNFLFPLHHTHPTSLQPPPNSHFWWSYGHFRF